ncbi:histone-lysine N-methyltransferase 2D [Neocloeon triangulifer]|uniref:histone-lysine N-methyltransferase 2D n=1 Tax=Neocloeon triangulifer TaxID=2078957 RepID=UPI00286EF44E|nr:histone-lysine N-methyltransferase 2D [Neocloeon triangulifer]
MRSFTTTVLATALLVAICLLTVNADTNAPKNIARRGTSNVEFLPSISRSLPSGRYQFPSHFFDRNTPALITRHRPGPRRLAHGKPPPYAVQMEPLVQYSQRDPLYQEIGGDLDRKYHAAPRYQHHNNHHQQPKYVIVKEPEPIIEIIVQDSNETLPTPAPLDLPATSRPREPVQVFYVKYKKDEHSDGVIYDKPVAAVTPSEPLDVPAVHTEENVPASYGPPVQVTTPQPAPQTTLRTIINPDSEQVHVNTGGLRISFGSPKEEHSYKAKRQQPAIGAPVPRFSSPSFGPQFGSQPDFSAHNRFLSPPPSSHASRASSPQFFSSFSRPNLPQFTGKFESFQQGPPSFSGKLEPVPFKQPSTGKIEFFDGNSFSSFLPETHPRFNEPVNGLPPPPPPFQRPTFSAPTFSGPTLSSFRSRPPSRPFPQGFVSQPQFSQPLNSPPATSFPPRLPQPAPFAPLPPAPSHQFAPQPPQFKPLPTQFSQPPPTTPQPQTTKLPATQPPPTFVPFNVAPSSGSEIVKSLSPSTDELQRQQQEQFRREQEYFKEIQKIQNELELRKTSSTSKAPFTPKKATEKQQHQQNFSSFPSTTPAPASTTAAAPASVPSNIVLPDEVPEDLRQQLISSGILNSADIQILDYDKVGDIPVDSLPPEALSQFLGATKGGIASASAPVPQIVPAPSHRRSSEGDNVAEASDLGSNNIPGPVEVKVVRYQPGGEEDASNKYVQDGATILDPVRLNDNGYNSYVPLTIGGSYFPIPNARELHGRNITSVVVLAPVVQEPQGFSRRTGHVLETEQSVEFVAGDALSELVQKPTKQNFKKFFDKEKKTPANKQSVILLVTEKAEEEKVDDSEAKQIFMYDVNSQQVRRLEGDLSSSFVQVAMENSGNQEAPVSEAVPNKIEVTTTTEVPAKKEDTISISSGYSRTAH